MLLNVLSREEALNVILDSFSGFLTSDERVPLASSPGRILAEPVISPSDVPEFDRATVDGFMVRASDTAGCSTALPALLRLVGEVRMGEKPPQPCLSGECLSVPTGGAVLLSKGGADAVVMLEDTEQYGDGIVGILKPAAPGQNIIFKGDDARRGSAVLEAGRRIAPHDVGSMAALGVTAPLVRARPKVGVLSTGDELVEVSATPGPGQIRDVNSHMLSAAIGELGCEAAPYGIVGDDLEALLGTVRRMASECEMVVLSGGSSAGNMDYAPEIARRLGTLLIRGVAMKPGKPTVVGAIERDGCKVPFFGLPGNPVAACVTFRELAAPLLRKWLGVGLRDAERVSVGAVLTSAIPSNNGREEFVSVKLLRRVDGVIEASPLMGKSGLITLLSSSDGFVRIRRDCEGLAKGSAVNVELYR